MTWHGPEFRGGRLGSLVSAVSRGPGLLDIFAAEADSRELVRWSWNGTAWRDGERLGGACGQFLAAAGRRNNLEVFAVSRGGSIRKGNRDILRPVSLRHLTWLDGPNGGWQPWEDLGGALFDSPITASCWRNGRWDVFGMGFGDGRIGTLEHWWYDTQGEGGPDVGGPVTRATGIAANRGVAVASWGEDRLDIFAFDVNLVLQHWWITYQPWGPALEPDGRATGGWQWHGPEAIPTPVAPLAKPSAVARGRDRLDVFWMGPSTWHIDPTPTLVRKFWDGRSWQEEHVTGPADAPIAVSWGPERMDVFALGMTVGSSARWLWHRWWVSGQWFGPVSLANEMGASAAVTWGPNRLDVFDAGRDRQLAHEAYDTVVSPPPVEMMRMPTKTPAPAATGRGHFDFLLNGNWEGLIIPVAAQVFIVVLPPGGNPALAPHYPMSRGISGWTVSVPASVGGPGIWGFQCHVAGVFHDGSPSGDKWSPLWVYDWEVRSPAAFITLNNDGSQPWDWSANVLNS